MPYRMNFLLIFIVFSIHLCVHHESASFRKFSEAELQFYRNKSVEMFQHAYNGYLTSAFPYDELKPLSCSGMDTWGSFSLTLIDALDTLAVMGNNTEFIRVVNHLISNADFNMNVNVSVFETNIRVVGGLISAHLLASKAGMQLESGWPCSGPLLRLAEGMARRLLPAFYTRTGMPYGTVNLQYGVPPGETPITCTAGVGTFIVEFGTLSRLTGDPVFERVALRALNALWIHRSSIGLVGNHINVEDGKWTAVDTGIGGSVDSYFEYLVKGSILFQDPKLMEMFNEYKIVITKHMMRGDWYFWINMASGHVTMPVFQSLESFWPGLLALTGDIKQATKTLYNYHQVWKQYGFIPELYDVSHDHIKRDGYPLRPELVESIMYLYQATKDPYLIEIGIDILESIERSCKTRCGYASVKGIETHRIEDRMESFFLAETMKYLFLLFDTNNFMHKNGACGNVMLSTGGECLLEAGGYVFNTEAHPIDISAVYCCSVERKMQISSFHTFQDTMDLYSILDINGRKNKLSLFKKSTKPTDCDDILSIYERIPDDDTNDEFPNHASENATLETKKKISDSVSEERSFENGVVDLQSKDLGSDENKAEFGEKETPVTYYAEPKILQIDTKIYDESKIRVENDVKVIENKILNANDFSSESKMGKENEKKVKHMNESRRKLQEETKNLKTNKQKYETQSSYEVDIPEKVYRKLINFAEDVGGKSIVTLRVNEDNLVYEMELIDGFINLTPVEDIEISKSKITVDITSEPESELSSSDKVEDVLVPPLEESSSDDSEDIIINSNSKPTEEPDYFSYHFPSVAADGDLRVIENDAFPSFDSSFDTSESMSIVEIHETSGKEFQKDLDVPDENQIKVDVRQKPSLPRSSVRSVPIVSTIPLISCTNIESSEFFMFREENRSYAVLFCPAQHFAIRLNLMGEVLNSDL